MEQYKDIEKAALFISDLYTYNTSQTSEAYFDRIYHFTTEVISGYFDKLDFKDKKVLTVLASGDHTLNAILLGSREIDTFDVNKLSIYYYKLKEASIKSLLLEEFKEFLYSNYPNNMKENKKILNWKTYLKVSPFLEEKYKKFWDSMYLEFNGYNIGKSDLFWPSESKQSRLSIYNDYLTEENYAKLKNILLEENIKFNFQATNIKELKTNEKYDYIFLSNISQYLEYIYEDNYLENFNILIKNLSNNLKKDGLLFHSYLYSCERYIKFMTNHLPENIYNIKEVKEKISNLSVMLFNAYDVCTEKDGVYIYKK